MAARRPHYYSASAQHGWQGAAAVGLPQLAAVPGLCGAAKRVDDFGRLLALVPARARFARRAAEHVQDRDQSLAAHLPATRYSCAVRRRRPARGCPLYVMLVEGTHCARLVRQ